MYVWCMVYVYCAGDKVYKSVIMHWSGNNHKEKFLDKFICDIWEIPKKKFAVEFRDRRQMSLSKWI